MASALKNLAALEASRSVTIGVDWAAANKYWSKTTLSGKTVSLVTLVLVGATLLWLIQLKWLNVLVAAIATAVWSKVTTSVACAMVRLRLLADEELFEAFYAAKLATVRLNQTGEVLKFHEDWRSAVAGAT